MEREFKRWKGATAKRFQKERAAVEVTQAGLAADGKFTQQMVSRYESGRLPKSLWFIANMIAAGYDVVYVLTGRRSR